MNAEKERLLNALRHTGVEVIAEDPWTIRVRNPATKQEMVLTDDQINAMAAYANRDEE